MITQSSQELPAIVAFVENLMVTTRIESVAGHLGYQVNFIGANTDISPDGPDPTGDRPGEPIFGPQSVLVEKLTAWQPVLLIFDLGNQEIPWRDWIALLKSIPATRQMPIICYGPHIDVEVMALAKTLGADLVVARSRFMSAMPELLERHARHWDYEGISAACQDPLSALALRGLHEFNRGRYFEAHEFLEDAWNEDKSDGRDLFKAILQIAVAYLQIERRNYRGAIKMFLRARQWLTPFPPVCRGIDVAQLRDDSQRVHETLVELGREGLEQFDRSLFRPVSYNQAG